MKNIRVVKKSSDNNYQSLNEIVISEKILDILFNPFIMEGVKLYIDDAYTFVTDISKFENINDIYRIITSLEKRNELYISKLRNVFIKLHDINFSSNRFHMELDNEFCYDSVDLDQVKALLDSYNHLINSSDVNKDDVKLVILI